MFCVLHNHADFTIFACLTSSHDRGFFPGNSISLDEPLTALTTLEALIANSTLVLPLWQNML